MTTPKEKAKELFNKMRMPENIYQGHELAKQCAIIAVDEIISHHSQQQGLYRVDTYYWQQVKKEIEKL